MTAFRRFEAHEVKEMTGTGRAPVLVMPGTVTLVVGGLEKKYNSRGIDLLTQYSRVYTGSVRFEVWMSPDAVTDRLWGPKTEAEVAVSMKRIAEAKRREAEGE